MNDKRTRGLWGLPLIGAALAMLVAGCGGGGGGGGSNFSNRSYEFTNSTQRLDVTVDPSGRFTAFVRESSQAPNGTAAQGTMGSDGHFATQSTDGTVQISGTVAGDGSSATGSVTLNGQPLFNFTAPLVTPTPGTDAFAGTFTGTASGSSALLSVDSNGHGTLGATAGGVTGGGLTSVSSAGAITSPDGTTGQLTASGGNLTLQLTALNGRAANATIPLSRVTRAKWTFLVYMNAANDLQEFAAPNVNQMEQVGSTSDVNMVLEWQQASCSQCGSPDWVGTRRYFLTKDNDSNTVHSQLVQDLGQTVDTGNWQELLSFINWAEGRYPADHYALVLWDHGSGWRAIRSASNKLAQESARSVSFNYATGSEIHTWELPQALNATQHMDLVVFDASLMQMIEVTYEMRNVTPIIVGSEESPPGAGYVYNTFLSDLVSNSNMTGAQFGKQIVTRTLEAYGTGNNLTQSEVDTSKLQAIVDATNTFANSLDAHRGEPVTAAAEANARNTAQAYAAEEPTFYPYKDYWDYADKIKNSSVPNDLKTAAANVQTAIQAAVLVEQHGSINGNSHGLSIYIPDPGNYLTNYTNLQFGRNTSWPRWLQDQPQ